MPNTAQMSPAADCCMSSIVSAFIRTNLGVFDFFPVRVFITELPRASEPYQCGNFTNHTHARMSMPGIQNKQARDIPWSKKVVSFTDLVNAEVCQLAKLSVLELERQCDCRFFLCSLYRNSICLLRFRISGGDKRKVLSLGRIR